MTEGIEESGGRVKLAVGEAFVMPDLDGAAPGAVMGTAGNRRILDRYHDTCDLRLARWGCLLRHREGEGWQATIPVPAKGRATKRQEVTASGLPDRPPPGMVDLVRSLTRGRPVNEVARYSTNRCSRTWTFAGQRIIELVDDRVEVDTSAGPRSWRGLEVRHTPGAPDPEAAELVDRLERAGAHAGGDAVQLVMATYDAQAGAPDVVEPVLGSTPTAREVIQAALARSVVRLVLHLPAARLGRDIEGVHQARVATRRLRSDLQTFRPLLDADWARALGADLQWLADDLGVVRDGDVLLPRLRATMEASPDIERAAAVRVFALVDERRRRDHRRLLDHLASERTDRLLDRLADTAADPRTTPRADDRASERLPPLVGKRWRHLQRMVGALGPDPAIDDLHRVRILSKRTRYAAEAVIPAVGRDARVFARCMAAVQDALGELNDAAVAEARLASLAETADRSTAFTAGRLAQLIVDRAAASGHDWERPYHKATSGKRQAWLQ